MKRAATLAIALLLVAVILLPACSLFFGDGDNPFNLRPCEAQFQCGPLHLCTPIDPESDKKFCVEQDKLGAIMAAYQQRQRQKCQKRGGHNPSNTEEMVCVNAGIPLCERCQKIRRCRDCPVVIPTSSTWYRGPGCFKDMPTECYQF